MFKCQDRNVIKQRNLEWPAYANLFLFLILELPLLIGVTVWGHKGHNTIRTQI